MNCSYTFKSLLLVSMATVSASANAAFYYIQGRMDNISNTPATVITTPYGTPWVSETIAAAQAGKSYPVLEGNLEISGGTIIGGSFTVASYSEKVFLGDFFGVAMDVSATTYSFGAQYSPVGFWPTSGSVVAGHCAGPGSPAICPSAYAGTPPLDYQLTDLGIVGGTPTWNLNLRFGTTNSNVTGGLTVMSFTLCSPYLDGPPSSSCTVPPLTTPVPAAAWLFGSSLIGVAGMAYRKRTA